MNANLIKAGIAALWTYGGRGIGLLWTVALIAQLGIADYGHYAMAFALAAIVAAPLDHPFGVRSIRVDEADYLGERTTRALIGVGLIVVGLCLIQVNYVAWFALVVAGGEMAFNAYKSKALRDGHPDVTQRMDTVRQASSIALATAYLFAVAEPTLLIASLLYVAPYFVIAIAALAESRVARPRIPGSWREISMLFSENLANAVYIQGDVLLLGYLTDSTIAGYYSVASVTAWAVAFIGQSFGHTFHEKLRLADGRVTAGPALKHTVVLGCAAGSLLLIAGLVLFFTPAPSEVAGALVVMSFFVVMRVMNYVFTTVLYLQHRDRTRVLAAAVLAPLKMVLILCLFPFGAVGAAIASVVTDAVLLVWFTRALYREPAKEEVAS
ncbi:lipopolysaccharide biosynthesis protein [Rhodococcoides kyotonense]|uniref:Membrane protein involved in the export of O-antigen and teichoic acid n=1 Tax=Rhodococcoides kyotonense TaxID=398843 RepID=A0A239J893_9NOCA|nr:polysaccharide biosynthesis C-terminal domain-containing protein [Rhodococcus kyotonensis]SNT01483.1 Membrane protein involved in the export of O-antigen and teichoic acid [Rhodococcus kyotonensis]